MNWIMQTFKKMHIKITANPECSACGKGFKDHTNEDLRNCSLA
ncbi:hypothetical protein LCGC14_2702450 [marine sediment metagenome]|uniref:Uncharacterized protein n=1 Tax=marine sediment metagenome TaxID=412755 RepID=A0A0F9C797_9ZZZZ